MTDSTNPRVMADNIKELDARTLGTAAEVKALQTISTDEIDTGRKWIDGRPIYSKVIALDTTLSVGYSAWTDTGVNSLGEYYLNVFGITTIPAAYQGSLLAYNSGGNLLVQATKNSAANVDYIYLEYIKAAPAGLLAPNPDDDNRSIETPEEPGEENKEEK